MGWILGSAFICGAFAVLYSLYAVRKGFRSAGSERGFVGLVCGSFKELFGLVVRKEKLRATVFTALSLIFLLVFDYRGLIVFWIGFSAPFLVEALSVAVSTAIHRLSDSGDRQNQSFQFGLLKSTLMMGCGLQGTAVVVAIAHYVDLYRKHQGDTILGLFAFGVWIGALVLRKIRPTVDSPSVYVSTPSPLGFTKNSRAIVFGLLTTVMIAPFSLFADFGYQSGKISILISVAAGLCVTLLIRQRDGATGGSSSVGTSDEQPIIGHEPNHSDGKPDALSLGDSARFWDILLYRNYTVTLILATLAVRKICGPSLQAAQIPPLLGTVGLAAWFIGTRSVIGVNIEQWSGSKALYLSIGKVLAFAGCCLYFMKEFFQVKLMGYEIDLLPAAFIGIFSIGLAAFVHDYFTWKFPTSSQEIGTRPSETLLKAIRRATVAACITAFPFLAAIGAILAGYYLIESMTENPDMGMLGIATTLAATTAGLGVVRISESEESNYALRKFGNVAIAFLVYFIFFSSYPRDVNVISSENLFFDLSNPKVLLGLLLGGLTPFVLVYVAVVGGVMWGTSLIRETRTRYRCMQ